MKKLMWFMSIVLCVFFLSGCGPKTTGKSVVVKNKFVLENCTNVTFGTELGTKSGAFEQETSQPTSYDMKLDFLIDWLESAGMGDAANKLKSVMEKKNLDPKTNVEVREKEEPIPLGYNMAYLSEFHHTQWRGKLVGGDKGCALVLCPGQELDFESCSIGGRDMPRKDSESIEGDTRQTWWSETDNVPEGDVECIKGNTKYIFKTNPVGGMINGQCK